MRNPISPFPFRAGTGLAVCALLVSCAVVPPVPLATHFAPAIASIPPSWKDDPVIALADTVNIRLLAEPEGNRVLHSQITWYYVNLRNPNVLERMVIPDFKSIEEVPEIQASAYYPDGGSWSAGTFDIVRMNYTEPMYYSSDRFLSTFGFPRYLEKMLIRIRVDRVFSRPEFLKSELLRDDYPSLEKTVILDLPKGAGFKRALINPEGLKADTLRSETETRSTFTVHASLLPKIDPRSMPRNPEAWYAALHFSFPRKGDRSLSWGELGDAYLSLISASFTSTPELAKLAEGLPKEAPDSTIRRVYSLLRNRIRYHADLEILHAFVPRPAGEVLAKGYGDCKEMATLMTQILRSRGVKAGVALVSTPGTLQVMEAFPSLGGFNHMIVYTEGPGGLRFFDPTVKFGDPSDSYFELIDRTVLPLREGGKTLPMIIPMGPGYRNRIETRSSIRPSGLGQGWDLAGTIKLEGQCAFNLLPMLEDAVGEEKTPLLKNYLKGFFAVDASECRLAAIGDRSVEVTYRASFNSNYLSMDKGGLLMAWPSLYGGDPRFTSLDLEGPRYFTKFEQKDVWEIPSGFEELEKSDMDNAIARGKWARRGAVVERTFASNASMVPAGKKDVMAEYLKQRTGFLKASVWRR
jgi:hypothetical protein